MKMETYIIGGLVLVGGYLLWKRFAEKPDESTPTVEKEPDAPPPSVPTSTNANIERSADLRAGLPPAPTMGPVAPTVQTSPTVQTASFEGLPSWNIRSR